MNADESTQFGIQLDALAYSQEPEAAAPQQHSWRTVVLRAVCLLAGGSLAALAISAMGLHHGNRPVHQAAPLPVPTTVETPALPVAQVQQDISRAQDARVQPVTKEGEFAYILQQGDLIRVVDMSQLPQIGKSTCNLMAYYSDEDLAQRMVGTAGNTGSMDIQQARRIVTASRQVYCPS